MKKAIKKLIGFIKFVLILAMLVALIGIIIIALEICEIITLPEEYSLLKILPHSEEITSVNISDVVEDYKNKIKEKSDNTENVENELNVLENLNSLEGNTNLNSNLGQDGIYKYYYTQLNEYGKILYDNFYKNKNNLKTGNYTFKFEKEFNDLLQTEQGSQVLELAFQSAINAFMYDNPDVFYIDIKKMYLFTETTTFLMKKTFKVYVGPENGNNYYSNGFNSLDEVNVAIDKINKKSEQIVAILYGKDSEKIKTVHDYIIENTEYDKTISKVNSYNIYGALIEGECVCEGYAKAFKYIMDKININCIFVFGTGQNSEGNSESHAWNYVLLNNRWYAVDTTWDDPIITGVVLGNSYKYKYFLKGYNDMRRDHFEDGTIIENVKFMYPELNNENY